MYIGTSNKPIEYQGHWSKVKIALVFCTGNATGNREPCSKNIRLVALMAVVFLYCKIGPDSQN